MPQLIKNGVVVEDTWNVRGLNDDADLSTLPQTENDIVPASVWLTLSESQKASTGVWLKSEELADTLGQEAAKAPLIAVHFPTFMDGRGFSTGRLLRERFGFEGELRAINVIRDQLFYLKRCGFDCFALEAHQNPDQALESLSDFTESYQAALDQPTPLFRRR